MSRSDLKELGETLDAGQAGLIAVYETNLADQVAANIKAANRIVSKATEWLPTSSRRTSRPRRRLRPPRPSPAPDAPDKRARGRGLINSAEVRLPGGEAG